MQLIARMREVLHVKVSLRVLFDNPTVAKLASVIETETNEDVSPSKSGKPVPESERLPLSFAQQRLWFLDRIKGSSSEYNIPKAFILKGDVDKNALDQAINSIIDRHQSLRTYFIEEDGIAFQVVAPSLLIDIPLIDLRERSASEQEKILMDEGAKVFELGKLPLIRAKLFLLKESESAFLVTMHHIVSDGWSLGVFYNELTKLYNAFHAKQADPLEPLSMQYPEFSVWQRKWLTGEVLARQLAYWKESLHGAAALELPADRSRPVLQTYKGARHHFSLSAELSARLKSFNQAERVTPFMSLLGAFQVLLARYSGQEDILVGTPIANRKIVKHEAMVGFFVNTLLMRTDISGQPGFREVVRRVRGVSLDTFEHQDLPFEKLVEELNPVRDQSRHPLFQVMFALQNAPMKLPALDGLEVLDYSIRSTTTHFDLELHLSKEGDHWTGGIAYCTDLFDAITIERFSDHYLKLLESMLSDPERPVSDLEFLEQTEREQLLVEWNDTSKDFGADVCVHQMFEAIAAESPDSIAVCFGEESLSYGKLNTRANQLARNLQQSGVGPNIPVGLFVERSLEALVALLAVSKAGGVCLPIDPVYPRDRITRIIEDARPAVILTQESLQTRLPDSCGSVLHLENEIIFGGEDSNLSPRNSAEDLAYILYTSGSTGQPKGVQVPHRTLSNLIHWHTSESQCGAGDRTLQFASFNFDASFQEIYSTWASGGTLVVAPEEVRQDINALGSFINAKNLSRLFLPFVALDTLANTWSLLEGPSLTLKEVITAGEQLKITPAIREMFSALKDAVLLNHYGPTETHVVTSYSLSGDAEKWPSLPSIGRPIANARIYILDRKQQPVPIGIPGEICVGGAPVARGYLNDPDLTAERFIPSPWVKGDILYRTGDVGRYRNDGSIEFIGRNDQQVKIRGYRVELGEVEVCLSLHPQVRECAVNVLDGDSGHKSLVGYIVVKDSNSSPGIPEIRDFLKERLPEYMVPASYVFLKNLPLSPNRKVDRKLLPQPKLDRTQLEQAFEEPRNSIEVALTKIWSEVLEIDKIGVHDGFFELGGHSLIASQVLARIRKDLKVDVPMRTFFDNATIAEFSKILEAEPEFNSVLVEQVPASFQQQGLWFLDRLKGGSPEYNVSNMLILKGELNREALEKAINAIVQRHQILRTSFTEKDGQTYQLIFSSLKIEILLTDLRALPVKERE
ncbi:MAG: amino acid adenylation domain-containing protein, partial [Verrucomicrobia bacterium]|nr:amino acid adenylation domain-containing protein [Verrucomicrobiota bacterium]